MFGSNYFASNYFAPNYFPNESGFVVTVRQLKKWFPGLGRRRMGR